MTDTAGGISEQDPEARMSALTRRLLTACFILLPAVLGYLLARAFGMAAPAGLGGMFSRQSAQRSDPLSRAGAGRQSAAVERAGAPVESAHPQAAEVPARPLPPALSAPPSARRPPFVRPPQ